MYKLYQTLTFLAAPLFSLLLKIRCKKGKELPERILEKKGITGKKRPKGKLIWFHAASVGEVQSTLILINKLISENSNLNILVTTGTITSAKIIEPKLPKQALHQFYPLDHPIWVKHFLNQWQPDFIIWLESELWPNMLYEVKKRNIPAILVNAHMSEKSYLKWQKLPSIAKIMLSAFSKILCQNDVDQTYFDNLGAQKTIVTDNLKYSAKPLPYNSADLENLKKAINNRPLWLYASTHKGEEDLACKTHIAIKKHIAEILTIIVPRHPQRRENIHNICQNHSLNIKFRGEDKLLPDINDDIYIADTLGELGLFYRLSQIAVIGRSFSDDGGGGHNPIEAAQLNCAILYGKNVKNLQDIFDEMSTNNAAICINAPENLSVEILSLLKNPEKLLSLQNSSKAFAKKKNGVINNIMNEITPDLRESKCL